MLVIRGGLLAFFLCLAFGARAADSMLESAQRMLADGRAGEAYALLLPAEETRAGEPAFDVLLGAAALQAGQPTRAVFALERALARQPGNGDARALLGQAYLALGEIESSRKALEDVRRMNPPAAIAARIDRMMGQISEIEKDQGTRISGYVEASLGADSNVNSATSSQAVAVPAFGGAIATLAPGAVRQRDEYLGLAAGVAIRHRVDPEWSVVARGSASLKQNFSRDQFDNRWMDGSVGAVFESGGDQFHAALQASTFAVDHNRYRDYAGVLGQWRHALSADAEASLYVQHGRLSYPGQNLRDADRTVVGGAWVRALATRMNPTVFLSAYAGQENERAANMPHLGHKLLGARAGAEMALSPAATVYGSVGLERRDFGGQEPFFLVARDDRQWDLQLGLRYAFAPNWTLQPSVSHLDNRSNVEIFRFGRTLFNIAVRYGFK